MHGKSKRFIIKTAKRTGVFLSLVILAFSTISSFITPKASAFINTDDALSITDQQNRTILYGFGVCLSKTNTTDDKFSRGDLEKQPMPALFNTGGLLNGAVKDVAVGYEIEHDDGNLGCNDIPIDRALSFVGKDRAWFIANVFDSCGTTNDPEYCISDSKLKSLDKQLQTLRNAKRNSMSDGGAVGPKEKNRRWAVALAQCIEPTSVKVSGDSTIDGQDYRYLGGQNGDSNIAEGHDLDDDGNVKCKTLIGYFQSHANLLKDLLNGQSIKVLKDNPQALALATGGKLDGSSASAGDDGGDIGTLGCHVGASKGNIYDLSTTINWILCPIIYGFDAIIEFADKAITSELSVGTAGNSDQPTQIFCDTGKTCVAYHKAWASFRDIALGLLIIGGLIAVMSQALGFELLDAYTIRKVLPRFLMAAVGITLSWQLMEFFVTLTNDLGFGIRHLIYAPFTNISKNPTVNLSSVPPGTGIIAALAGYLAIGAFGILTFAASGALALLVAFVVLILRQVAIIMLLITAPIAIVCYILPNTQRIYSLWWESFSRALLMFPMIAGIIAAGRVFATVSVATQNGQPDTNPLHNMIAFGAYFAPYFLIPATFKFAGGAVRNLGGMVNDRSRGAFDRIRKSRQDNTSKRIKAARANGIYRDDHRLGRALNRAGNWTLDTADTATVFGGRKRGLGWALGRKGRILEEKIAHQKLEHSRKAAQNANLHYSSGRAVAGLHHYALGEFKNKDGSWKGNTQAERDENQRKHDAMENSLKQNFGIYKDGKFTGKYRAAAGEQDVLKLADIYKESGQQNAMHAANDMYGKAAMLGSFKGPGKEETQRADLETIGLMAAAQAGRLENHEISASQASGNEDKYSGHYGTAREQMLRAMATQKRVEQAEKHGQYFEEDDHGHLVSRDVYAVNEEAVAAAGGDLSASQRGAQSEAAYTSLDRINYQELGGGKSEAIDALEDTLKYHGSDYEMTYDINPKTGKREVQYKTQDETFYDPKTGKQGVRQVRIKKDPAGLARARAVQNRIKTIGGYTAGDSGVGRKTQAIADFLDLGALEYRPTADQIAASGVQPPPGAEEPSPDER